MDFPGLFRSIWLTIAGWFTAAFIYFAPIHNLWLCILIVWIINFFVGYITGMLRNKESFSRRKAMDTMREVLVYLALNALMFVIGERMHKEDVIIQGLNIITWAFIYFYLMNIFQNLRKLMPKSKGIEYVHNFISAEFLKKIPGIKND